MKKNGDSSVHPAWLSWVFNQLNDLHIYSRETDVTEIQFPRLKTHQKCRKAILRNNLCLELDHSSKYRTITLDLNRRATRLRPFDFRNLPSSFPRSGFQDLSKAELSWGESKLRANVVRNSIPGEGKL
jgi:hypothetical protein